MKKALTLLTGILMYYSIGNAQKEALSSVNQGDLKSYMTFFASDQMAGRETGTPENDAAALYIKTNLMRLGFKPSVDGDYFQYIPMSSTTLDVKNTGLSIRDSLGNLTYSTDSLVAIQPSPIAQEFTGDVVFAGYGYIDSTGYDDLEGLDLKDKIVIVMTRTPRLAYSGERCKVFDNEVEVYKLRPIFMSGPKAVLLVYDPRNDYKDAYSSGLASMVSSTSVTIKSENNLNSMPFQLVFITRNTADQLLKTTGYSLAAMQEKIRREGKPVSTALHGLKATVKTPLISKDFKSENVIAVLEGSDPVLKNECIVYSAHFDHIGKKPDGEVFNGADDNASGSMALLEVAGAYLKLKKNPLRTVIFVWANGEEKGLLGSGYYADHPVIPMDKTLADFNLDMVGRTKMPSDTGSFMGYPMDVTGPGEIIVYTAHESTELGKLLQQSAAETGMKVIDKGKDLEFGGSDHMSFRAKGVPAMFFHSGIHSDLHNTGDDVEKIDFEKMEKVSKMVFLLGYRVANQKNRIVVDAPIHDSGSEGN
jgi:hypothetical protein